MDLSNLSPKEIKLRLERLLLEMDLNLESTLYFCKEAIERNEMIKRMLEKIGE